MERTIEFTTKKILFYILGFLILGFGVNIMARSDLGLGAWDTVTFNLNELLNNEITRGMTSMIISFTIMTFVVIYNKKWVLLFMLIPIFAVGLSIDFWDLLVLKNVVVPDQIYLRILFYIIGVVCIPLGLASILTSHFPAFVFDEWTLVVMDIFNTKSITKARLGIELMGISLGILFGILAGIGLGYVSYGSVIFSIILPPMFDFFVKLLGRI